MKTIVFYTFAFMALVNGVEEQSDYEPDGSRKQVCTPGSTKMMDCNSCFCLQDGSGWGCTLMLCLPKLPNHVYPGGNSNSDQNPSERTKRGIDGQTSSSEPKQICTPGSKIKQDCNTCTCSQDGTALACTRMACPKIPDEYLNPDDSMSNSHIYPVSSVDYIPRKRRNVPFKCTPNESFMDDCNHCLCSPDGRFAACTLMGCSSMIQVPQPDTSSHPSQNIQSSGTEQDEISRQRRNVPFKCTPNETFMDNCNQCRCSPNGRAAACTLMACPLIEAPHRIQNYPSPLIKRFVAKRDAPLRCVPNQRFLEKCNDCLCSSDGRTASCTLMACDDV